MYALISAISTFIQFTSSWRSRHCLFKRWLLSTLSRGSKRRLDEDFVAFWRTLLSSRTVCEKEWRLTSVCWTVTSTVLTMFLCPRTGFFGSRREDHNNWGPGDWLGEEGCSEWFWTVEEWYREWFVTDWVLGGSSVLLPTRMGGKSENSASSWDDWVVGGGWGYSGMGRRRSMLEIARTASLYAVGGYCATVD